MRSLRRRIVFYPALGWACVTGHGKTLTFKAKSLFDVSAELATEGYEQVHDWEKQGDSMTGTTRNFQFTEIRKAG